MDRQDFERLRDLPGKTIRGDIRLRQSRNMKTVYECDKIAIEGTDVDLRMNIRHNIESGYTTINVVAAGQGPVCRVDVDGPVHHGAGRSHKHSLREAPCPGMNLPHAEPRHDLNGRSPAEVLKDFCERARIDFQGVLVMSQGGGS